jgi:hypothetical protein
MIDRLITRARARSHEHGTHTTDPPTGTPQEIKQGVSAWPESRNNRSLGILIFTTK